MVVGLVQNVGIMHHLRDFIIIKGFSKLLCDSLKTIKINHSISLGIPKIEYFCKACSGFIVTNCWTHNLKEFIKFNRSIQSSESRNHLKDDFASTSKT